MPAIKDYYKILGIGESASADEIKKAYRALARKHHPDRNQSDTAAEERFKEIQEAYETLSDAKKRVQYDRARKNPFGASGFGEAFSTGQGGRYYRAPDGTYVRMDRGARSGSGQFGGFSGQEPPLGGIGDLFGRFFGGDGDPMTASRRVEPETEVVLTFEEALEGGKVELSLPDGAKIRVPFPKGVEDGYKVRLKRKSNGQTKELYVRFRVSPGTDYRREGHDLHTRVEVTAFEAMLGASRSLVTPHGRKLKLTIPKGTQPGERLRLRNQGVETEKDMGDLLVEIVVTIPKGLTRFEEEELRKAAEKANLI
ncbi:MAG: J domain-containing protein [Rhodothermales bacterium]|nr:J domain-containing protein [Rhodothermales bacterium]